MLKFSPSVLFRGYRDPDTGRYKVFQQGKTFWLDNTIKAYTRDITNRVRLWKDNSWIIDLWVFLTIKEMGVKLIHYYDPLKKVLFETTVQKIENLLEYPWLYIEKVNGHSQIKIPYHKWVKRDRLYWPPWIKQEVDVNKLLTKEMRFEGEKLKLAALKFKTQPIDESGQLALSL